MRLFNGKRLLKKVAGVGMAAVTAFTAFNFAPIMSATAATATAEAAESTETVTAATQENPDELIMGIFFNSEEDMTDTLYVSFDGITFKKIGEAYTDHAPEDLDDYWCTESPHLSPRADRVGEDTWYVGCVHDPGLIYKDGYFWTVTGFDQEINGEWKFTPMLGYSKDLVNWSFPNSGSMTNISPTGILPFAADGTRTNTRFDSGSPDIMLDDDGTVWMVVTMGYYAQWHGGHATEDKESCYLVRVDGLTAGCDNPDNRDDKGKSPIVTYSDAVPINLPDDCDNRIDGSLYKENGKYYLSIKRNGVTCEIWSIDTLSLESVQNPDNWTLVNSDVVTNYEGPCMTKYAGNYYYYTDKLGLVDGITGVHVARSSGLENPWTENQPIVTIDVNGNTIPTRHGTAKTITDPEAIAVIMERYREAGWTYDPTVDKPAELELDGWYYGNGNKYYYEDGVLARDKQVYVAEDDAWYWFDADGTMAKSKDVFVPKSNEDRSEGKWVRYDENGHMIKGEDHRAIEGAPEDAEWGWWYFDPITGEMIKGLVEIETEDGETKKVYYDDVTGLMLFGEHMINGELYYADEYTGEAAEGWRFDADGSTMYWYENGIRQGYKPDELNTYRGKEIYDPEADAWFWLDNVQNGAKAVSKDVYQESLAGPYADNKETGTGKWVRYDAWGLMVKGWNYQGEDLYYFDPIYGAMVKGTVEIDGVTHYFDESTGILVW